MITVNSGQLNAMRTAGRRHFEARMTVHLNTYFPEQCDALGDVGVLDAVSHGIERASTYGLRSQRDVCKYIDLMFTLGRDFDVDPRLPWVRAVLNDPRQSTIRKIDRLTHEAQRRIARYAGIDHVRG
jgi:hypothetical protein